MFLHLLALAGLGAGAGAAGGQPTISNLVVTPHAGSCPAGSSINPVPPTVSASIDLSWSISLVNDAQYEIHISENGGAPSTKATSNTNFTRSIAGLVEGAQYHSTYREFTWAVSLVRKSDGATLQTLNVSYASDYGQCGGPA